MGGAMIGLEIEQKFSLAVACHFLPSPKNIASKFSYRWSMTMTTMITFMEAFLRTAKHPAAKIFTYTIMGVPVMSAANFIIALMIYLGDLYYMTRITGQGKEKYVQARGPGGRWTAVTELQKMHMV
jgi:hypothetical protein